MVKLLQDPFNLVLVMLLLFLEPNLEGGMLSIHFLVAGLGFFFLLLLLLVSLKLVVLLVSFVPQLLLLDLLLLRHN